MLPFILVDIQPPEVDENDHLSISASERLKSCFFKKAALATTLLNAPVLSIQKQRSLPHDIDC